MEKTFLSQLTSQTKQIDVVMTRLDFHSRWRIKLIANFVFSGVSKRSTEAFFLNVKTLVKAL